MTDISQITTDLIKSLSLFLPETTLVVTFIVALFFDLIFKKSKNIAAYVSVVGIIIAGFFLFRQTGIQYKAFASLLVIDPFGQFMKVIVLASTLIIILVSFFSDELHRGYTKLGEYFTLMTGMVFGMFLLIGSANLITIYLAIETVSISSYILAGYTKEVKRASEASLKYVIFGAISSGIMLYGISILFGLTGSLNLFEINQFLQTNDYSEITLVIAGLMILSGFGYKISAVPFHFWTPDVYEGSPVTITAYLSVASKAAGFAVLIRFFKTGLFVSAPGAEQSWELIGQIDWHSVIAILAILTMTLGNLAAIWQTNMKRLLAYSSIAHAGYLLMAVTVMNDTGVSAVLIYFFIYMIMNLGAFFIVQLVANKLNSENIEDYDGLGYRSPVIAVSLTVFLISLTGLPPTAGFIGKLYVFTAVIEAGYIWLAVIGVLNSVVSLYYYVKIIRNMYLRGIENQNNKLVYSPVVIFMVLLLVIPVLILGVYFSPLVDWSAFSSGIFTGK